MAGAGAVGEQQMNKAIGAAGNQRGMMRKKVRDAHLRQETKRLAEQKFRQLRMAREEVVSSL